MKKGVSLSTYRQTQSTPHPSYAGKSHRRSARLAAKKTRADIIAQVLFAAALLAIVMVVSGVTTGTLGFVLLLISVGVGIFLVRSSLKQQPTDS